MAMKEEASKIENKAIGLRKKGHSLLEISDILNIPKTTIQGWVKNVKLTKKQEMRLMRKASECGKKGLAKALIVNKKKKEQWKNEIIRKTKRFKTIFDKKSDVAKLICGVLYICEGAKYPSSRQLVFANSDPRMIKLFLDLLRKNFNIDEKKFRCRVAHRYDQKGDSLSKYWSVLTKVPLTQFYRTYKDKRTKGKTTKKKDYKGICALCYLSADLQYEIQSIGETIY